MQRFRSNELIQGDVLEVLRTLPDGCVQMIITSPPYWSLRDYGIYGQVGLEETPGEYVDKLVGVFREARRVLREDGTLWLNIGDSYFGDSPVRKSGGEAFSEKWDPNQTRSRGGKRRSAASLQGLKPKDLVGIPWRVAFALREDGWYLRSDIIWAKPNPMPEPVVDRPTKSHEYLFLLSKKPKYYYDSDAIREAAGGWPGSSFTSPSDVATKHRLGMGKRIETAGRNSRGVWTIPTQSYPEAHFATFPEELCRRPILAGTSEKGCCPKCGAPWERVLKKTDLGFADRNFRSPHQTGTDWNNNATGVTTLSKIVERETVGWQPTCECNDSKVHDDHEEYNSPEIYLPVPCVVLDPFCGSGTACYVANELGRHYIGIDLNEEYLKLARKRLAQKCIWED